MLFLVVVWFPYAKFQLAELRVGLIYYIAYTVVDIIGGGGAGPLICSLLLRNFLHAPELRRSACMLSSRKQRCLVYPVDPTVPVSLVNVSTWSIVVAMPGCLYIRMDVAGGVRSITAVIAVSSACSTGCRPFNLSTCTDSVYFFLIHRSLCRFMR